MTRKHFIKVAAIIAGDYACSANDGERNRVKGIALSLSDMFAQENPLFDRARFLRACGF